MDKMNNLPDGLNVLVLEGKSNLIVGQRQLLCLTWSILCKNKILVFDDPTSHVDLRTNDFLQLDLYKTFNGAKIISVAHRMDTVIEYNKILVLGKGKVLEYGSPKDLLSKGRGKFTE